jgi:hypothetical protein
MTLRETRLLCLVCGCLAVCWLSCDESLPARIEPENVVIYGVTSSGPSVVVQGGEVSANVVFSLTAKNTYDEVISDKARLAGTLTIRLKERPDVAATLEFSRGDLLTNQMLSVNTLIIQPGQTLVLSRPWSHRTDAGTPLWEFLHLTRGVTDQGRVFYQSDTTLLQVSGSLQIFEKVQAAKIPVKEFWVLYTLYDTIVDPTTVESR